MAKTDIIMPQMGESIAEGTITKWLKGPGDSVRRDEPLFEISTDKVDAEIPSPTAGVLAEIKVGEGETVEVNSIVGTIADSMEEAAAGDGGGDASATAAPAAATTPTPPPAPSAQPAAAPSPSAGVTPTFPSARGVENKEELQRTRSTPVVRRMAQEHGIDISGIVGTGVSGRVTKQDLLAYIEAGGPAVAPSPAAPAAPVPAPAPAAAPSVLPAVPAFQPGEAVTVEAMSIMRKKIAEHMVLSRRTAAHVQTIFEIDCSNVINTRKALQDDFVSRHGQKLTITPFFVKAAVEALRAIPIVNASLDGDNIVYKRDINVGVAVALEWGLIVPVIHNADDLSLVGINRRVADLAERARTKQLKPEEVQGGTFTITNPGVFGSLFGTPIINQPQVAILGMGTIEKRVKVVENDAIIVKPMMFTCLSFDHRIIDGAVADQFMGHLKKTLESADFKALL
ncbi:MAG: 2-oxo acid dehydrogenase subunit E2 [Candidatus Latescibacterota bacterium]|nr:MAG: 2-oxo acid dehydrogenase subunit E2 [Candidatus Latescibacterota bacterium]